MQNIIKRMLQPSRVRRVVVTLLAAFELVFGVLIAIGLQKLQQDENNRQELRQLTQALAESI